MSSFLIENALIINEKRQFIGHVLIRNQRIEQISTQPIDPYPANSQVINAKGKWLIPGVIDDQVHFRDPGLTHKGTIYSESRAGVAGGITS